MHKTLDVTQATAGLEIGQAVSFKTEGGAKLSVLHREDAPDLPKGEKREIRVLEAILHPGDQTPFHSHRHPVTVVMLEGVFSLDLADRGMVEIEAGEVFVEPAHVTMTGYNKDHKTTARMILFYACDADVPFADPA